MKHRTRDVHLLRFALFCFVHTKFLNTQYKQLDISHLNRWSCQTTPDPGARFRFQLATSRSGRVVCRSLAEYFYFYFRSRRYGEPSGASWSLFLSPAPECPGRDITCPIRFLHTSASKSTTAVPSICTPEAENHIHRIKIVAYMSALKRGPYGAHTYQVK